MKHKIELTISKLGVFLLSAAASCGLNAGALLDTTDPQNGVLSIYSFTFDGSQTPCTGSSPPYCSFFGGDPPATSNILISPNPSGIATPVVPGGIGSAFVPSAPAPGAGSWLNLTLSAGNTLLTLAGGTVTFPSPLTITIPAGTLGSTVNTVITATNAGVVFDATPVTVPVDGSGVATFQVNLAPNYAVDFSAFSAVTSCTPTPDPTFTGLCGIVAILNLDMIKYYLVVDYNASFTAFTAVFRGQTGNNSIVTANMNSIDVAATNSDADSWPNAVDNCTVVTNENQRDTQTTPAGSPDGYGNICDPDFNNDGTVNINDFNRLKARLNITPVVDVDTDLDGNGAVNINDLNRLKSFLGKPPGPSALRPLCPPTCP